MHLALRNLFQDRLRLALSVLGIALAVMLILFLLGLRAGVFAGATAYIDHAPGSIVVMPEGVRSTSAGSAQMLSPATVEAVRSAPGVAAAVPVLLVVAVPEWHGTKEAVRLVGYDETAGGGPWSLAEGREPAADHEVVVDRVLASRHEIKVGGSVEIGGHPLTVSGISNETSSFLGAYVFARKSAVEALMLAPGAASFVMVTPEAGVSDEALASSLRSIEGVSVLPKNEVSANNRQVIANIVDRVIVLMVGAAFIVGALVVGMVIYTATIERRSEYGVLKAIGAGNRVIYRVVLWQAVAAAGLGVIAGIGLAFAVGWLVTTARPQFLVTIEPPAVALTLGAGLLMALLGALVPARAVARLAPAEVFRR
jgi:putative ABC transport system permease protein